MRKRKPVMAAGGVIGSVRKGKPVAWQRLNPRKRRVQPIKSKRASTRIKTPKVGPYR